MNLPLESIPDEWTTDPAEIQFDLLWKDHRSQGQDMGRRFGLSGPQVIMTAERDTGNAQCMFQSGERCYIWNVLNDTVWEIIKPTGLLDILQTTTTKGERALKVKEIEPLEVDEDKEHNE
ncbi:hypothetical protein ABOM_002188 [Aspergillus bombycis]|uniref:Uncharacterized protein n=1 Tax=Aspergillus bombycis TaxID=109264 RepID=A0A1F8A940_9EURO|nr:hypothetical protein ABOM_002188 [Aspergillus bombycis]OGM48244.1 hypothetical protein ABOM_002188 [Aspergillus bombycis]